MRIFIRFITECIKELLYIVGAWIKANILAFTGVTAFFVLLVIAIKPMSTVEDVIAWSVLYMIFIFATFDKKPNLQHTMVQEKEEEYKRINIKQSNVSLISVFKNTKK
nr:hypothetical protein [uncultured Niameybacter sp.]